MIRSRLQMCPLSKQNQHSIHRGSTAAYCLSDSMVKESTNLRTLVMVMQIRRLGIGIHRGTFTLRSLDVLIGGLEVRNEENQGILSHRGIKKDQFHGTRPILFSTGRTAHFQTCAGAWPRHFPERPRSTTTHLNVTSTPLKASRLPRVHRYGPICKDYAKFVISLCEEHAKLLQVRRPWRAQPRARITWRSRSRRRWDDGTMGRNILGNN
jgi:hypothetical protein